MRSMRVAAWATLITQIIIVGTGGAVRLTGSGLGCDTWPACTSESLVPALELHGVIEFSNRLFGLIVSLVAAWMLLLAIRNRARRNVVGLAVTIIALTLLQIVVGGISVRVQLPPTLVGIHFVISAALVAVAAALVWKVERGKRGPLLVGRVQLILTHVTTFVLAVVVIIGVATTGSGPHAGDERAVRNGFDPELMQHLHAIPAYVLFGLTLVLGALALAKGPAMHRNLIAVLFLLELVQIVVGIVQSNLALPALLVGIHMILAVLNVAVGTAVVLSLRDSADPLPKREARLA